MDEEEHYSHDTGAIRDVADNDMPAIAQDIQNTRVTFATTAEGGAEAFRGYASSFTALKRKWTEASVGIAVGLATSQSRVGDAAENLHATADEYDGVDTRAAGEFDGLLRLLSER